MWGKQRVALCSPLHSAQAAVIMAGSGCCDVRMVLAWPNSLTASVPLDVPSLL